MMFDFRCVMTLLSTITFIVLSAFACEAARPFSSTTSTKTINEQFLAFESNGNGQVQNGVNGGSNNMGKISQPTENISRLAGSNIIQSQPPASGTGTAYRPVITFRQSSAGTNFPSLPTVNQGQTNVKQLVQIYNNRDEEARRTQMAGGNKTKPLSYSSVLAGAHKQTNGQLNPTVVETTSTSTPRSTITSYKTSSGQITNDELKQVSEALLRKDSNNAAKLISINYQGKTSSSSKVDNAPSPLLQIPPAVWNIPTIRAMQSLLDNYEKDVLVNEHITPLERNEENTFLDAVMETAVMRHLMNVLKEKGIVTPDPRQQKEYLKQMWFTMYSRGQGKIGSSGFEHIFLVEIKNNAISGLHNWLYFALEETAHRANYLGYLKKIDFGDKGGILKFHFNYNNIDKPVDSMFVGTSPELEMALYTLCFVFRADTDCPLTLGGKYLTIRVYTFRYRSKNMIGSAYPEI